VCRMGRTYGKCGSTVILAVGTYIRYNYRSRRVTYYNGCALLLLCALAQVRVVFTRANAPRDSLSFKTPPFDIIIYFVKVDLYYCTIAADYHYSSAVYRRGIFIIFVLCSLCMRRTVLLVSAQPLI
jgi:hypothetical protein